MTTIPMSKNDLIRYVVIGIWLAVGTAVLRLLGQIVEKAVVFVRTGFRQLPTLPWLLYAKRLV